MMFIHLLKVLEHVPKLNQDMQYHDGCQTIAKWDVCLSVFWTPAMECIPLEIPGAWSHWDITLHKASCRAGEGVVKPG